MKFFELKKIIILFLSPHLAPQPTEGLTAKTSVPLILFSFF